MRLLFDQGTPQPLRRELKGHVVDTVYERGWSTLSNGVLLATAETAGYDLLVTTDQNLRYQQNLTGRRLAILVLRTTSWHRIRQHIDRVQSTIDAMSEGSYLEISFDGRP
jgi:predicted nuclease of predicted toxin-antitoxin system